MFSINRKVHLFEVDAAGVIFFGNVYNIAQEAFEFMIEKFDMPVASIIYQSEIIYPIIHSQAEYFSPIRLGQELTINVYLGKISESSFTLVYEMLSEHALLTRVKTIQVAVNKKKWEKSAIPTRFAERIQELQRFDEKS